MNVSQSSVVRAKVSHSRRAPAANRFVYGMDYLLLDEAALSSSGDHSGGDHSGGDHSGGDRSGGDHSSSVGLPKLFAFGRPNLISLRPSDHGVPGVRGTAAVRRLARQAGIGGVARVLLLAHPRYWGYVFNPVSFWFLLGAAGGLRAVLAEVHNTFGDRHAYLCAGKNGADIKRDGWTVSPKRFHVSPFFDIAGHYRFRFQLDASRVAVQIRYEDGAGGGLDTALVGERLPFTDKELLRALLRRPFGSLRATALIHWQALRLWRKKIAHRKRPAPPQKSVT